MIHDDKWNLLADCDEAIKVPPPSPQDASMLEAVFSNHLSAKIHAVVNSSHGIDTNTAHARTLERLLSCKKRRRFRSSIAKRPSRIPVLSSRICKNKATQQQDALTKAFERIHISKSKNCLNGFTTNLINKSKNNDISVKEALLQSLKDMEL
ncbi:hypothetical protein A0J61_00933 [Choanephora cucurbitarum]|uniref:Uncharacterized protein n=1 Tax=Choanephora cucurbitarum TaxID=101091 RepID=A0A1C7NPG8_9FUNG|nr:hypothetical protein A0J61_00933 [Choanephora cucurbitarum]